MKKHAWVLLLGAWLLLAPVTILASGLIAGVLTQMQINAAGVEYYRSQQPSDEAAWLALAFAIPPTAVPLVFCYWRWVLREPAPGVCQLLGTLVFYHVLVVAIIVPLVLFHVFRGGIPQAGRLLW